MADSDNQTKDEASSRVAQPGENCWKIARADKLKVVIDAADYFKVIQKAMAEAKKRIIIVGWDFDTRIVFDPRGDEQETLGAFVTRLAKENPEREILILKWDFGMIKSLFRGSHLWTLFRWMLTKAVRFKFDSKHPHGCSHHQKIVVIDDCLAVCGGIDLTSARWDTREHRDTDDCRKLPNGKDYCPWHDATTIVNGEAARALGEHARHRWNFVTGDDLQPVEPCGPRWLDDEHATLENIDVAIARTQAECDDAEEIREIEMLYCDMIARARRFIYAENQYFTSPRIAGAMAKRLAEDDPPEIVLVGPLTADGWLEQVAMDGARVRLADSIIECDKSGRFGLYFAQTEGGTPIYIHAKIMIVDDELLRVGSSNMNNRSLGLDSECDILAEAEASDDPMATRTEIRKLREDLMAEHLGVEPEEVADAIIRHGGLNPAIRALQSSGRTLKPVPLVKPEGFEANIADNQLLDPDDPDEFFESTTRTGLMHNFMKARRSPKAR